MGLLPKPFASKYFKIPSAKWNKSNHECSLTYFENCIKRKFKIHFHELFNDSLNELNLIWLLAVQPMASKSGADLGCLKKVIGRTVVSETALYIFGHNEPRKYKLYNKESLWNPGPNREIIDNILVRMISLIRFMQVV